jgi:hypothetical protein
LLCSSQCPEIERFANSIWMGWYHEQNLMIVLDGYTACFDRSYNDRDEETVVAGFVSSVQQWSMWEAEWRLTLAQFNVPYFHMKEFVSKRGAYRDARWKSEPYRARFMAKLIAITNQWAIAGIASACKQSIFDHVNQLYELDSRFNPFAFCGRDCAVRTRRMIREEIKSDSPIAFIFDHGDEGKGLLMKEMERSLLPSPIFKRSRTDPKNSQLDIDDPPIIQLQACDLLAWEIMRGEHDARRGVSSSKFRKSVLALSTINNRRWFGSDIRDLTNLCISGGIAQREPPRSV